MSYGKKGVFVRLVVGFIVDRFLPFFSERHLVVTPVVESHFLALAVVQALTALVIRVVVRIGFGFRLRLGFAIGLVYLSPVVPAVV